MAELTHPVPPGWTPERWVVYLRAGADVFEQKAARELPSEKKAILQEVAGKLRDDANIIEEAELKEKQSAPDG